MKNGTDHTENADSDNEGTFLPLFEVEESGPCTPQLLKCAKLPPKAYIEVTLLEVMETAGKSVEAEELREALKKNGIGRLSTRSAIIETLIKRGYVQCNKKKLTITQAGMYLIDTISYDLLKSLNSRDCGKTAFAA